MRPKVVVVLPKVLNHHTRFGQRPKLFPIQAFIAEPPVKTLDDAVLSRTARLDIDGFDLVLDQPLLDFLGNEL